MQDGRWSEAITVGSLGSVETIESDLGVKGRSRDAIEADGSYALREATACSEQMFKKVFEFSLALRA